MYLSQQTLLRAVKMQTAAFNASNVDLDTANPAQIVCYLQSSGNGYSGQMGARVSAVFVILIVSTVFTLFPVLAKRFPRLKIPLYMYLFARYFGTGVIIATAFIHLLDPAYGAIGPNSCVGMTGGWSTYPWPPAIVLASIMAIFMLDLLAQQYVEWRYGAQVELNIESIVTGQTGSFKPAAATSSTRSTSATDVDTHENSWKLPGDPGVLESSEEYESFAFRQQIAAFLILEFGIIFHSVFIGLNFGVSGDEFWTLYPVLVFHQSFEGLGIGARMSAIPFPKHLSWLPWVLIVAYGLTTPIATAIGIGLRETYDPGSFTAKVVEGVFDSVSAGILIYNGLVELLARDFLFDPQRTKDNKRVSFMVFCVLLGAGIMALLGKWA